MMPLATIGLLVIGILIGAGVFYLINNVSLKKDRDDAETK
jgi:hypothetical protein